MTPEQITTLAREYAEWITKDYGKDNAYTPCTQATTKIFLRWLSQRYCLVEKEKVNSLCRVAFENGASVDYGLIDGLTDFVMEVFPEQYHQVADNPEIAKEVEE